MHKWLEKGHPNLVAYYDFNEGKGTVLHDLSGVFDLSDVILLCSYARSKGNNNHGVLKNGLENHWLEVSVIGECDDSLVRSSFRYVVTFLHNSFP